MSRTASMLREATIAQAPGLVTATNGEIYGDTVPQGKVEPWRRVILYQGDGGVPNPEIPIGGPRVRVWAYGADAIEAEDLDEQVREFLRGLETNDIPFVRPETYGPLDYEPQTGCPVVISSYIVARRGAGL